MDKRLGTGKYLMTRYPRVLFEFLVFGFLGLIVETSYIFLVTGGFEARGALGYGLPIIHIYAFGALIVVYLLGRFSRLPIFFFIISAIFMSFVELIGSYIETFFGGYRSWNYINKPFNFQGRVCLSTSLGWGTLAFLFYFLLYPEIVKVIGHIPRRILVYGSIILTFFIIFVTINKYVLN